MSRDVFISYKTEDKEAAEKLCAALEGETISCWMAPRDIPPGSEWATSIVDGLQRSTTFVLLLSSHSIAAKQISREAELADQRNIPILTFRLEDVQPPRELLYFLGNVQWLDGFGGRFDAAAAQLANLIRNRANRPAAETPFPSAARAASVSQTGSAAASATTYAPSKAGALPAQTAKRSLIPLAAGLVLLAAMAAWLALRSAANHSADGNSNGTGKANAIDAMQQAKAVSDRFLKARNSGNYEAAWTEYTTSFRNRENRESWQKAAEAKANETGGVTDQKFDYCKSSEPNVYICEYTLTYKNGLVARSGLWVVKDNNGSWAIDKGTSKALSR